MNYQFRKKPVTIEAFQMTKERRWNNSEWPNWLNEAWNKDRDAVGAFTMTKFPPHDPEQCDLLIQTLEGPLTVSWGDFIIRGVKGELYPCKPDIFAQTYDVVVPVVPYVKKLRADGFPRRSDLQLMTPVERALFDLVQEVEELGAHPRLTDAVIKLGEARDAVADFTDLTWELPVQ